MNKKLLRFLGALALPLIAAGCSGINVSPSVSPATFLMPGIGQVTPQKPSIEAESPPTVFAQAEIALVEISAP